MARSLRWIGLLACATAALVISAGCGAEELREYSFPSAGYDHTADPSTDLQVALREATRSDRRVLMEVGGDWCIWCHHWERFLADNEGIRDLLEKHYVVVKVNHGPRNLNEEFLAQYPDIPGYPHFFVLDANGSLLLSQGTEVLEKGSDGYDRQRVVDFLQQARVGRASGPN